VVPGALQVVVPDEHEDWLGLSAIGPMPL